MVIDSEDKEVGPTYNSSELALLQHLQVSSDAFKVEFEAVDDVTKSKVLELFDPVRDDLKLELFENISEVEAGIRKGQEESPDNQELGELARRMGELGAGIVREAEAEEEEYIRAQRIFAANSMQVMENQHMEDSERCDS